MEKIEVRDIKENVSVKREVNRFMNRFFYHKDHTAENLAKMYYYLDDFINYLNSLQATVGTELLGIENFGSVYLKEDDVKVYLDDELQTILVDALTPQDEEFLRKDHNRKYVGLKGKLTKENLESCDTVFVASSNKEVK